MNEIIEFEIDEIKAFEKPCSCCNNAGFTTTGVIIINGNVFGMYNSSWVDGIKHREVLIIITHGDINEDGNYSNNITVCMKTRLINWESEFMMIDGKDIPFNKKEYLGKVLSRKEALEHKLSDLFFRIGDKIVNQDSEINAYLSKTMNQKKM